MRTHRSAICPATGHPSTWRCTVSSAAGGLLLIAFELTYWWKSDVGTRWVERQGEGLVTWKRRASIRHNRALNISQAITTTEGD